MDVTLVLFLAGFVLFFGLFSEWLFVKTHIPDVLWMVLLGVILQFTVGKPSGLDSVAPLFITFALIFIVFEGASGIPLRLARTHFLGALKLSAWNFSIGFLLGFLIGLACGLSWQLAFILGCIAPALSGGIIGQIDGYLPTQKGTGTLLAFEAAVTDVGSVLGVVTMVSFTAFTVANFLNKILSFFLLSSAIGFVCALVWVWLLKRWITEHSYILTIAFLLMVFSMTEYAGANGSVAAMAFALTLGNIRLITKTISDKTKLNGSELGHQQKRFYSEISFMIRSFLFVWMGLIVEFTPWMLAGCLLCLLLYIIRSYTVHTLKGLPTKDKTYMAVMGVKDITALVLASLAVQARMVGAQKLFAMSFGLIMTSIVLTSILVFLIRNNRWEGFDAIIAKTLGR